MLYDSLSSLPLVYTFWLPNLSATLIKLAHPLNPMQPDHMHHALHHIQNQHHSDGDHEEDQAFGQGYVRLVGR